MRRFSFSLPVKASEDAFSRVVYMGRAFVQSQGGGLLASAARYGGHTWQCRLIYLAIVVQIANMLLAMYMTSFLRFGDVLLDVFGTWNLALISKCLAFAFWILLRDRQAARVAAGIIAPLSVLALLHDLLLLTLG